MPGIEPSPQDTKLATEHINDAMAKPDVLPLAAGATTGATGDHGGRAKGGTAGLDTPTAADGAAGGEGTVTSAWQAGHGICMPAHPSSQAMCWPQFGHENFHSLMRVGVGFGGRQCAIRVMPALANRGPTRKSSVVTASLRDLSFAGSFRVGKRRLWPGA